MSDQAREHWEAASGQWIDWVRAPDQDPYGVEVNLPELLTLVPPPGRLTLDVGCGEGRVARMLSERGHTVVGTDGSPTLAGASARSGTPVTIADSAALAVRAAVADIVVSSMVLMDVPDLDENLRELNRVLRIGGTLLVAVGHPLRTLAFPLATRT